MGKSLDWMCSVEDLMVSNMALCSSYLSWQSSTKVNACVISPSGTSMNYTYKAECFSTHTTNIKLSMHTVDYPAPIGQ